MKKGFRVKVVMFWTAIVIITVGFLALFGTMIFSVTTVDSLSDMTRAKLSLENSITDAKEDEYYVYIYSEDTTNVEKKAEIETSIFSYATFYQKNKRSGAEKLYAFNTKDYASFGTSVYDYLKNLNSDIKQSNIPLLVEVVDGEVNSVYYTINTVQSELQSAMNEIIK